MTASVTVCAQGFPAGRHAVQWAAAEARRRGAPLEVVVPDADDAVYAMAMAAVRRVAPGLPVLGHATGAPVPAALRELSADSAALVVPASAPDLRVVVAESYCPVIVVPDGTPPNTDRGPVVLSAVPWTGEEVFELAFREADERHAPLMAVRIWNDQRVELGRLLPGRIARWDEAVRRARQELEIALSEWRVIHPDVEVQPLVVEDRATDFLLALSYRARLLVLGRSARGALLAGIAGIAGSPITALLRASRCPVVVVPAEGPPRWRWLPTPARGLSETGH